MRARIRFWRSSRAGETAGADVTVPTGSLLSEAIAIAGLPLARACGADGLCGSCGISVLAGRSSLAPETDVEMAIKRRNRIDPELRLACRTLVVADLEITASYW